MLLFCLRLNIEMIYRNLSSFAKPYKKLESFDSIDEVNKPEPCTGFENFVMAHLSLCFYFSFFEHTEMIYRNLTSFAKPYKKLESFDKI